VTVRRPGAVGKSRVRPTPGRRRRLGEVPRFDFGGESLNVGTHEKDGRESDEKNGDDRLEHDRYRYAREMLRTKLYWIVRREVARVREFSLRTEMSSPTFLE